jgi:hypothetical protein
VMNTSARLLGIALRICGVGALALGLAFWFGYAWSLRRLHIALGIGVVVCLWALAGIVWRRTPRKGLVAFAVVWGLGIWLLGVRQNQILAGSWHWLIEVAHLAVGAVAMAVGAQLARAIAQVRMAPNRH